MTRHRSNGSPTQPPGTDPFAAISAFAEEGAASDEQPADHLFWELHRRLRWRAARAWGARAAACALLVGTGFIAGATYVHSTVGVGPSYALALNGAHLVLDDDDFTAVRRLTGSALNRRTDGVLSAYLGHNVHAPRMPGLKLIDVQLLREDATRVAGLVYRDGDGRRLTLSLSIDPDGVPDPRRVIATNGQKAVYWSDGRSSYGLLEASAERFNLSSPG